MKGITQIRFLGDGREIDSQYGKGIGVACRIGKEHYIWTIKYNKPNYTRLFERFGSDITRWKGIVKVERKKHKGNEYVAVLN
jgi:hypothetical protein